MSDKFITAVQQQLPGFILLFDLADTKRRNLYLGWSGVDSDIQCFDLLLKEIIGVDLVKRIGGNRWLCFCANQPEKISAQLNRVYSNEVEILVRWGCKAISNEREHKTVINEHLTKIARAYRGLMIELTDPATLADKIELLTEHIYKGQLNGLTSYPDSHKLIDDLTPRWQCINIAYQLSCPFCQQEDFNWLEGTEDTSYGICNNCQAECDFHYAFD